MTQTRRSPDVDAYIEAAEPFARPILSHLREMVRTLCPEVDEAVKYSIPHLSYRGQYMVILAAYSQHCSFTFWKQEIMSDPRLRANLQLKADKRFLGKLRSLSDLPPEAELAGMIREAMRLNEEGAKLPERASKTPAQVAMPEEFRERLAADPAANAVFEAKSPSFRKEYLVWITDAKTPATREKRIAEALEWIAEGKSRFWKNRK